MIACVIDSGRINARLKLALRAERAFGLSAVRFNPEIAVVPPAAPMKAAVVEKPRLASAEKNLFGAAAAGKPAALIVPVAQHAAGAFVSDELPIEQKILHLRQLDETQVKGCTKCGLCTTRTNTVFGEGAADAKLFFIGEGPGEDEDLQGRPFVGRSGGLLTKMIAGMGLRREDVFIANIVKCRPPGNRNPAPEETAACTPYLVRQLEIIRPKVIVTLGLPATQYMLGSKQSMSRMRGVWHEYRGIKLMPTFHPAYVLRNYTEQTRRQVWEDLQKAMLELGLKPAK